MTLVTPGGTLRKAACPGRSALPRVGPPQGLPSCPMGTGGSPWRALQPWDCGLWGSCSPAGHAEILFAFLCHRPAAVSPDAQPNGRSAWGPARCSTELGLVGPVSPRSPELPEKSGEVPVGTLSCRPHLFLRNSQCNLQSPGRTRVRYPLLPAALRLGRRENSPQSHLHSPLRDLGKTDPHANLQPELGLCHCWCSKSQGHSCSHGQVLSAPHCPGWHGLVHRPQIT